MNWLKERFEALRSIFEPLSNGAKASDHDRFAIDDEFDGPPSSSPPSDDQGDA